MQEGWLGDDYVILFDDSEVAAVSERYSFQSLML
jgi:hypothetical protein